MASKDGRESLECSITCPVAGVQLVVLVMKHSYYTAVSTKELPHRSVRCIGLVCRMHKAWEQHMHCRFGHLLVPEGLTKTRHPGLEQ